MSECTEKLKINPALRLLVLPLSTAEYTALETDILTNGSQKPVQCWHSYIISDFERVEICRRHKISFDVYKTNFLSEIEIVAQICERELSERILPSDMRRYLIGKLYNAEKVIAPHRAAGINQCKERRHRETFQSKEPTRNAAGTYQRTSWTPISFKSRHCYPVCRIRKRHRHHFSRRSPKSRANPFRYSKSTC